VLLIRLIIVCAQTYYCVCTDLLLCVYRLIIVCLHTYYFFAQTYYCVCKDYVLKYVIKYVQDLFFQHQIVQSPSLAFQRIRMTLHQADDLTWKRGLVVLMNLQEIMSWLILVCAQTYYCVCTDLLLCVYRLIIVCVQTYYCVCTDLLLCVSVHTQG
jgi:hypothetical protein